MSFVNVSSFVIHNKMYEVYIMDWGRSVVKIFIRTNSDGKWVSNSLDVCNCAKTFTTTVLT